MWYIFFPEGTYFPLSLAFSSYDFLSLNLERLLFKKLLRNESPTAKRCTVVDKFLSEESLVLQEEKGDWCTLGSNIIIWPYLGCGAGFLLLENFFKYSHCILFL